MRRSIPLLVLATALLASPAPLRAQDGAPVVAVLPFQNAGSYARGQVDAQAMERDLTAALVRELSTRRVARPVPAAEVQRALAGTDLGQEGRMDAGSAAQVGRTLGARYVVAATFLDHFGKVRLDARIVDVSTDRVVSTASAGPAGRDDLPRLVGMLADRIMASIGG